MDLPKDISMEATLGELAEKVGGRIGGDPQLSIHGAAPLEQACDGDITLIDSTDRIPQRWASSHASAVLLPEAAESPGIPAIWVADVHRAFSEIVTHFRPRRAPPSVGISPAATVSPTAKFGSDVHVFPGATIGDDVEIGPRSIIHSGAHVMPGCKIGEDVVIMPAVVLYEDTVVGSRVTIHAGAVLGAYGFGYTSVKGRHQRSAQLGNVEIGSDVEIGAQTTIDRGTYGATVVGDGTKIDNLVMIAHNCRIGRHNIICSQVGIAGSTTTGDFVVMAGQVGVRDHVHISEGAVLGAKAGVSNDVPAGSCMIGIPATPERDQKLKQAALAKLPAMRKELKALKRTVAELSKQYHREHGEDGQAAA